MTSDESQPASGTPRIHPRAAAKILAALDRIEGTSEDLPSIDGFRIARRLGSGGDGAVYLGFREQSDQPVAIKVLHHRSAGDKSLRRVWRELDVLRGIRHPALPRLLDHGECSRGLFLVTEFIDGVPLDLFCASHHASLVRRVELLADAAEVVHALHEYGVIHRDVKPGNILIDAHERPVLIDLGIATLLERRDLETLTLGGEPIGSPSCMSPEQARGERDRISTRSDVFGIGATGYLLLADGTPHDLDAPLHEVVRRIGNDETRDPRQLKPTLPRSLAIVLRQAVSLKPEDRYASAAEFAADLRRWLRHEPVLAGGITPIQRAARFIVRHPTLSTALACLAIAISSLTLTWAAVSVMNGKPASVQIDVIDRSWVRVNAYNGNMLKEWRPGFRDSIVLADLLDRDTRHGGGRVFVLGVTNPARYDVGAQLSFYNLDDLENPYWTSGTKPPDIRMPPPISRVEGEAFKLRFAMAADVFPQLPGIEVIASHSHAMYSPAVIRVYSLSGEVLWELWHDGGVLSGLWMAEAGLLVISALNSENNWRGRGYADAIFAPYPLVVFAVKPRAGEVRQEWIRTPGGLGTVDAEWYQCLLPPEAIEALGTPDLGLFVRRSAMHDPNAGSGTVFVWLIRDRWRLICFEIDASGREIGHEQQFEYDLIKDPPDPAVFRFGDLPRLLVNPLAPLPD